MPLKVIGVATSRLSKKTVDLAKRISCTISNILMHMDSIEEKMHLTFRLIYHKFCIAKPSGGGGGGGGGRGEAGEGGGHTNEPQKRQSHLAMGIYIIVEISNK